MIEDLMERTDPGRATVSEAGLQAVFSRSARERTPARASVTTVRIAGFALAGAVVVGGILAVPVLMTPPTMVGVGDYPYYATLTELEEAATAVLVVDIENEEKGNFEGIDVEVMTARIVIDADREKRPGDVISIKEMPGEDSLVVGGRYVVFIVEYEEVPASLVNPTQGAYLVVERRAEPQQDNSVALDRELLQRLGLQYGG